MDSELNTSSPVAGISLTISSYLEKDAVSRKSNVDLDDFDETESDGQKGKEAVSDKKADKKSEKYSKKADQEEKSSKYDSMAFLPK